MTEKIPEYNYTEDLSRYPSHFRYPRPHPLKEVLEHYDISVEGLYEILEGWPDRPSLSMLSKMLEGDKWMPWPLEAMIWRKIFYSFGPLWILVGGLTAGGPYLTHDGRLVDLVERASRQKKEPGE
jgi:hypothetical protein